MSLNQESAEGRKIHALAEEARESGDFLKALELTDQAALIYEKDSDLTGLAEVQSSRAITFNHLYRQTGDEAFQILQKHAAEAAVDIAGLSSEKDSLVMPYFNRGKYYLQKGDYKKAEEDIAAAIKYFEEAPPVNHNRPAVIADMRNHLAAARYKGGDKTALDEALAAIEELKNSDEPPYIKNAWLSGAHLRVAEMLINGNKAEAVKHLNEAEKIITSDPKQKLRLEQLEDLKKNFSKQ